MLRMQEMTFPGIKFQKFSGGVLPHTPPFMRGILDTHVAFSHCYPPLTYYLTERSLFKNCPPMGKSLKKALGKAASKQHLGVSMQVVIVICFSLSLTFDSFISYSIIRII
jgi:hypothetical protein